MNTVLSAGKINAKGEHTPDISMDYFSKVPKTTIEGLFEVYKHDFAIGGYEYPDHYINIGVNLPMHVKEMQLLEE